MNDETTSASAANAEGQPAAPGAAANPAPKKKGQRRTRFDAVLQNLPAEVQEELFGLLGKAKTTEVLEWLEKEHKVRVAGYTLGRFKGWYPNAHALAKLREDADIWRANYASNKTLQRDLEDSRKMAQVKFEELARQQQDPKSFIRLQKLRLEEEKEARRVELAKKRLKLERRRQALAEKKVALKDPPPKPQLTPEERQKRIKELWGLK